MKSYFVLLMFNFFVQIQGICQPTNSTYSPVILDPYVSILDKQNPYRYDVDHLLPLISTVATKFNVVIIDFNSGPSTFTENTLTGKALLPFAIAKYNEIVSNQTTCLETWLLSSYYNIPLVDHILRRLINEFSGGAYRLLLNRDPFKLVVDKAIKSNDTIVLQQLEHIQWIISECVSPNTLALLKKFKPGFVLMEYHIQDMEKTDSEKVLASLKSTSIRCEQTFELSGIPFVNIGLTVSISDTLANGRVYMQRMIEIRNALRLWSNNTGNMIVFSKAFDSPYENTIELKTNGWWSLVENAEYRNSTEYIFKDKSEIAKSFDHQENTLFIFEPTKFQGLHSTLGTGVIFNFLSSVQRLNSSLSKSQLESLLKTASNTFSKAIILFDRNLDLTDIDITGVNQFLSAAKTTFVEILVMFLGHVNVSYYDKLVVDSTRPETAITYYFTCERNSLAHIDTAWVKLKDNLLKDGPTDIIKIGCTFDISICGSFDIMSNVNKENIILNFNRKDVKSIAFQFVEEEETVKLGASRMFAQRIVMFDQCRKILLRNKDKEGYEISFVLLNYATDINFYSNPWAIQTFVKYWEMLRKWSENSENTTVILGDALDGTRLLKASKPPVTQIGWWRILRSGKTVSWINKKMDAIQVAKGVDINHSTQSSISTQQVVIIVVSTLVMCAAIAILTISVVRSRRKETIINREEFDEFLNGCRTTQFEMTENPVEATTNPYQLPYDESKYEISPSSFSVNFDAVLGSGEFGMVLRGKVGGSRYEMTNVAVKVINEKKVRKDSIIGLLAEIKILAYIGKHDNIIELIGANTTDIMNGKVFVFLEFCVLGSLEKYLRKLQQELPDKYAENSTLSETTNEQNYENLEAVNQQILDPSLCDEFFRWCTEICSGMAYLSTKHVVHADLATRNVLLNSIKQAKICDFGLSRRMYNYTNYVKTKQEPLPWKWMSPESLKMNVFHEKSDVWAYGVLLWEIYSLGDTPYSGLSWDVNFVRVLEGGLRLGQPKYDDKNMYTQIMNECWKMNPKNRPNFADILSRLSTFDT